MMQISRNSLITCLLILIFQSLSSQTYQSLNNYSGRWESSASWSPVWQVPQSDVTDHQITINGYISAYGSLSFSGVSKLIVRDTLVIKGNLTINDNNHIKIEDKGILIVWGNLTLSDNSEVEANGYLIIVGDIFKVGNTQNGRITSNDNPVRVFIGGNVPIALSDNNPDYKPLNCTDPTTHPYPNSTCGYGNMTDIINDNIYQFFQTTCVVATPFVSASGPTTFCDGGNVTLISDPAASYLWSTGETTSNINVTRSGSYTVIVKNASGCQSAVSAAKIINVNTLPPAPTITADAATAFCNGGTVTLTSSAGSSYLWSTGATTPTITVASSGNYAVKVTNANGCESPFSVGTIVTVKPLPSIPVITASGPTTFCAGGSVTLVSSSGSAYLWSNGEITQSINVASSGSYTLRVTNPDGCQSSVSAPVVVNINPLPVVSAGADVTIPNGTSTTINATVTGSSPFTYSWSPSSQLVNASTEDPTTINLTATTIFTLIAASTATLCSNKDDVQISVSGGALSTTPEAVPATVCSGTNVQLHALASGGSGSYTYSWTSNPVGFTSSAADPSVIPLINTIYNVAVNDGFSTVSGQVLVTVNPVPSAPTITANGPTIFCSVGSVLLTSSSGSAYLWSTGETTPGINVTTAGSYWVQVLNSSGCKSPRSVSSQVQVNAIPVTPTITAGSSTTFCAGGSVILTSSPGPAYLWSTGETTQGIIVTVSGSYTVQVANASGCQSAPSVPEIVTVNASPAAPTISTSGATTFCEGGNVILTSSTGSMYLWSDGTNSASNKVTSSGTYSVTVSDANGCKSGSSAPVSVVVNPLPHVAISSSSAPMCSDEKRTITATPAGGTFTVTDGPGVITGNLLSARGPGITDLIYNYSAGCPNNDAQRIDVLESPVAISGPDQELTFVFETKMNAELSGTETGEWTLVSGSGNIVYPNSPVTLITRLSQGENVFLWHVRNDNCEASAETRIIVNDLFVPSVITPNGDGLNDFFEIAGDIGKAELIIVNRWGMEEYSNRNYLNEWEGQNNRGEKLPNDTYFYILIFDNSRIKKGSVLVKK